MFALSLVWATPLKEGSNFNTPCMSMYEHKGIKCVCTKVESEINVWVVVDTCMQALDIYIVFHSFSLLVSSFIKLLVDVKFDMFWSQEVGNQTYNLINIIIHILLQCHAGALLNFHDNDTSNFLLNFKFTRKWIY